jgi:hypothetical protein
VKVRSACFQQFAALGAEVEMSCHCCISRRHNELIAVILKVVRLWDIKMYFLSLD